MASNKAKSPSTSAVAATSAPMPIAIIGVSGRYPKSPDLDTLWQNLTGGVDCVGEADGTRWDLGFHVKDSHSPSRIYTRAGGFLDRIDLFDAEFFGMSPREARQVDPQHRLLLELTWEALEASGIVPADIAGSRTGVFVGISGNDYATLIGNHVDAYTNIGSALSIASNRISYIFDLHGPSMSIDTACSSSLVALHQACRSIASGDCGMALVGGVNILAGMRPFAGFAQASMLSPDGRCKSFDADGKGYVRAEGGGIVILKPLADAERDGDNILAVIKGTSVNSDGKTMGMALPSGEAQEALLRQIYTDCGVTAEEVFYVEAHGTGTAAGDPIECGAIARVLGAPRQDGSVCHIGSIKSNIGHLESGAGMAGLTKVLLSIRNRQIPANLHFNTPNPKIDFEGGRLSVVATPLTFPASDRPLVFGINSFGFGGTNAHCILTEYRAPGAAAQPAQAPDDGWTRLLMLSAQSTESLALLAERHAEALDQLPQADWHGWRATAARSRARQQHRLVLDAGTPAEAAGKLRRHLAGEAVSGLSVQRATGAGRLGFVFSGNGPQWWGMGRELLAGNAVFRAEMEAIDALFAPLAGWSLIEMMGRPQDEVKIARTEIAQPLLFAQQVALAAALKAAGIVPQLAFGHSVGEAAAAHVSGALSRAEAVKVIYHRSQMQAKTAGRGRMAAVAMSPDEARAAIAGTSGWIELAAINAPKAVTLAGDPEALQDLCDQLTDEGRFARMLPLNYAFHTSAMDDIEAPLRAALADLAPQESAIPFVSTVTGDVLPGETLDADYWWRNIRAPVAFEPAVRQAITAHEIDVFVELGPHPVLRDYVLQTAKTTDRTGIVALQTLRRPSDTTPAPEIETLTNAVCAIHAAGGGTPERLYTRPARPMRLPAYPWNRIVHWRGGWDLPDAHTATERDHVLLGHRTPSAEGLWTNTLQAVHTGYLLDHVVQGSAIFPAAGYMELTFAAALSQGEGPIDFENFEILKPMVLGEGVEPIVQLSLDSADGTIAIRSRPDTAATAWTDHARGRISRPDRPEEASERLDLAALAAALPFEIDATGHYAGCVRRGMAYGPAFQGVVSLKMSDPESGNRTGLGEIRLPDLDGKLEGYRSHPAVFDNCLQLLISMIAQTDPRDCATIPVQVGRIRSLAPLPAHVFCQVTVTHENSRTGVADMVVTDTDGRVLMTMTEGRFQKVEFRPGTLPITAEDWRPDPAWVVRHASPLVLPAPAEIAAGAAPALAAVMDATARAAHYDGPAAGLDRLAGAYAAKALRSLPTCDKPFTLAALAREAGIPADRIEALEAFVEMVAADGHLLKSATAEAPLYAWTGDRGESDGGEGDPEALRRDLMLAYPGYSAEIVALGRAGGALAGWLTGEIETFPAIAMPEAMEDTAPFRLVYNRMAAETLRSLVAGWPAGRGIRVVELSGATGGLSASVLPVLPPTKSDYLFVDHSEQATTRAGNRFGAHHILRTEAVAPEALTETGFDIALSAADVPASSLFAALTAGGIVLRLIARPGRVARLLDPAGPHRPVDVVAAEMAAAGFEVAPEVSDTKLAGGAETPFALLIARKPVDAPAQLAPVTAVAPASRVLVTGPSEAGSPFVAALTADLEAAGQTVSVHALDPADLSDDAFAALVKAETGAAEFIHLAGFAETADGLSTILDRQDMRCLSAIALSRAIELRPLEDTADAPAPTLTIVTRGAFATPGGAAPLDPFQATIAGTARVIANEQVAVGVRLIDVHATPDDTVAATVLAEALLSRDEETETLLVDGRRYVHRVRASSIAEQTRIASFAEKPVARPFRLDFLPSGGLDSLHLREITRRAPEKGEVEIRVRAAGLNFRDVLWAMGMLPEEAVEKGFSGPTIGMECAGEVVAVGDGVTHLKPGDRVIAFASSCFATHVTTDAGSAALIPASLSFAEAATIPTAFVTAWYALDHLARLEPGETVLIHGAAGGVGLAALQIAKLKGATVIATAGAADKQKLVAAMGADHVFSSRSLKFADDVMRLTGGKGVDVVLNSLAGEAITKGLQVLKPFGRFLEIGKRDLYANSRIGLRPFRQNLSYFGIDADTLLVERPKLAARVFGEVVAALETGALRPLPHLVTPISRAEEAFRAMQQARHVGKLVIGLDAEPHESLPIVAAGTAVATGDGTWLVTGGLGGFGLSTAEWLVANGARSLALLSRRGDQTEEAQAGLARIRASGATVRAFAVDVADRAGLARVLADIRASMAPLTGIVHSAALIEDAPLIKVDRDLMHRVMSAKMLGAWHLHELTKEDPLTAFVLYSSSSVMVGNPGQGTYVAANAFLNALAELRRAEGLPALATGWGAIKDAGFLTRNQQVEEMLEQRAGMEATPTRVILAELGRLMAAGATTVSAAQFNLLRLGQSLPGARTRRFSMLIPEGMQMMAEGGNSMAEALTAMAEDDRRAALLSIVGENVARVVGLPASQVESAKPLSELGLDSLMAVELAEALEQTVGRPVSVMQMIQAGSVAGVVEVVMRAFAGVRTTETATPAAAPADTAKAA
ncbi:type I polyketide synthase [Rhizobium sp. SG2393]|uniref:type I polyketide synthase n=1 Tax=Rhizobium sp. SG2393 TaxID=3276279 RepID=UPI003671E378